MQKIFRNIFLVGFLLPVAVSAQQTVVAEPIGTALVTPGKEPGTWYAAKAQENSEILNVVAVSVVGGRVVWPKDDLAKIDWIVDDEKIYYATSPSGYQYLYPYASGSTELRYKPTSQRGWKICEVTGRDRNNYSGWTYESVDGGRRILMLGNQNSIRYYAASNLGRSDYGARPVLDYPVYDGYVRSVGSTQMWGTCCPARDVASTADMAGAEFYQLLGKELDAQGVAVSLVFEGPCTQLEAGRPYLFKKEAGADRLALVYSGERAAVPVAVNGMLGSFEAIPAGSQLTGKYVVSGDKFVRCAEGSSLLAYGAYVDLDQVPELTSVLSPKVLRLRFGGGVSAAVDAQQVPAAEQRDQIYDLSGNCVGQASGTHWKQQLKKGIYIVNGEKIIIE